MKRNNSALGTVIHMDYIPANWAITKNYVDADNFYPADGEQEEMDEPNYYESEAFIEVEGNEEEGTCNYKNYEFFENGDAPMDFEYDKEYSDTYSNANGRLKSKFKRKPKAPRSKTKRSGGKFEKVMSYTPLGMAKKAIDNRFSPEGKAKAEKRKAGRRELIKGFTDNKKAETQARIKATEALAQPDSSDALIAQMTQTTNATTDSNTKKKLTTIQVVGISIGVLAVAGTIGYFVLRNKNK